ncbi:MAG TPA: hypothetical protein VE133_18275, partial [Candidatus Sulfotelmatobacter sp.]|nr:hypothetical protein [Candidatus Sulfotelmatobacter sp.]
PPLVITSQTGSASVKAGSAGQFVFDVEDDDPTLGMVAFGCSGLPVGTACTFNPPATNLPLSQVTMTISTSSGESNRVTGKVFGGDSPRFFATLFFPVLGLVGIGLSGRRNRKTRLRFAMAVIGLLTLLTLVGCGGGNRITTPVGSYQITVTAATTTVQATSQVTLAVQ